jgi:hypothetical protein
LSPHQGAGCNEDREGFDCAERAGRNGRESNSRACGDQVRGAVERRRVRFLGFDH